MNYAENILQPGLSSRPDAIAVTYLTENMRSVRHWTYSELACEVSIWAERLKSLGLRSRDSVAGMLGRAREMRS